MEEESKLVRVRSWVEPIVWPCLIFTNRTFNDSIIYDCRLLTVQKFGQQK